MTDRALIAELCREVRAAQLAVARLDQAVADRLGVNPTDHRCLDLLDQRGPMTAGVLAEALGLTRSAVTTVIDRLAALHYVRRVPGERDRRQVRVELTPLLRRRAAQLYGGQDEVTEVLRRYTDEQLTLLRDFVRWDRKRHERRASDLARSSRGKRPTRSAAGTGGKRSPASRPPAPSTTHAAEVSL